MASDDRAAGDGQDRQRTARRRSRLFAVRLWAEEVAGGTEYRGNVRDLVGGAFRGFRDWSDLTAFMTAQIEDAENARMGRVEGESGWPVEERR